MAADLGIPKHIIQTWEDKSVPEKWQECIPSILEHMPDWKHTLFTAKDRRKFIKDNFPEFLPRFDSYGHNVQRADAWRYLYLYLHGGVYMDLDFVVKRNLDTLFEGLSRADVYVVFSGTVGKTITNSFIAAKPGCKLFHDVYIEMLRGAQPWWAFGRHLDVMTSTGPYLFNRIAKMYHDNPDLGVAVEFIPREKFFVCSCCDPFCSEDTSYVRGLPGQSWTTWDTRLFNCFICNWPWWVTLVLIVVALLIICIWTWLGW